MKPGLHLAMNTPRLLLKGGNVLTTLEDGTFQLLRGHDVLVADGQILKIHDPKQGGLEATGDNLKILDCTDKLVAPGFISTHNHTWQTQLKGRHGDDLQLDFIWKGNLQASNYTPYDVYLGVLGGCLESIDAGITTVVDHAHMSVTSSHALAALAATVHSGIRSLFCYTPPSRTRLAQSASKKYLESSPDPFPAWSLDQFKQLGKLRLPDSVKLGFASDDLYLLSKSELQTFFGTYLASTSILTGHWGKHPLFPTSEAALDLPTTLVELKLPPKFQILLSHCPCPGHYSASPFTHSNGRLSISSVPHAEIGLGIGPSLALNQIWPRTGPKGAKFSLGVGCLSICASEMFTPMRTALTILRQDEYNPLLTQGSIIPCKPKYATVENMYRLATADGAAAIGLNGELGRLAEGYKADIVVFDTSSPSMSLAAEESPVTAIVNYASARDIEHVIINGVVRKENGKLCQTSILSTVEEEENWWWNVLQTTKSSSLLVPSEWKSIATRLQKSREAINARMQRFDGSRLAAEVVESLNLAQKADYYERRPDGEA